MIGHGIGGVTMIVCDGAACMVGALEGSVARSVNK